MIFKNRLLTYVTTLVIAVSISLPSFAETANVRNYAQLQAAISNASVDNIIVTADIDVPCETSGNAGNTDLTGASTAQLIINRSLTLQSQPGSKYVLKRVAASGATYYELKSLIAIRGNGNGTSGTDNLTQNTVEVSLTNIIIDGGADWGSTSVSDRFNADANACGYSGRATIDVYLGATLNLEDGVEVRNGFTTKSDNSLLNDASPSRCFGGAIRVDYHNNTGGGTVNIKAGASIHDCTARDGYGGALGAYNYARLNLYGGTISDCSATYGGAIACTYRSATDYGSTSAGTIRMYGGAISNCCATNGGAFLMHGSNVDDYFLGGTITGCSATYGGVMYVGESKSSPNVHLVEKSSGWLIFSSCSNTNATSTESTGGYNYIYKYAGTISETPVYQVTFRNNNTDFAVLHVLQGNSLGEAFPAAPVNADFRFVGWYNGETQIKSSTSITSNMTVTAKWDFLGSGTADTPYLIPSADVWNFLVDQVAAGNNYSGKFFCQTADFNVTTMVGASDSRPFSGTYDGGGYTISVNLTNNTSDNEATAPFRYIRGATIKNLHTTGSINTNQMYAAGIVGRAICNNTIINCSSDVFITSTRNGDGTDAGLVGTIWGDRTTLTGCVFTGKLLGSSTDHCGGLVGWCATNLGASLTIENCLYAPQERTIGTDGSMTFTRGGDFKMITITNSYYTETFGDAQGKQALSISAGDDVTISNLGAASATYNVSGITVYAHGIKYGDTYYAGSGDAVSLTLNHAEAAEGNSFGSYTASSGTLSGSDNPYTLTMANSDVIISAAWLKNLTSENITIESVIYNGGSQTAVVKYNTTTMLSKGTDYTVVTEGSDVLTDAGSTTFTITGTGSYTGTVEKTFTITSKALTITANAQTITYGGSITNGIGQVTTVGLVEGDALNSILLTKNYTDYGAEAYADGITPSAAVVLRDENTVTSNYDITYVSGALTINKASITPSVSMAGWTYGDDAEDPVVTNNIGEGTVSYTYMAEGASEYTSDKPTNAGTHTVKATIAATTNYSGAETTGTYTVGKAALSVTAKAKTITYGDAPANDGVAYSGLVNGETETVLSGELAYVYNYAQYGNVGDYTITPSGLTSSNYNITFNTGTLTVDQKEVTLSWSKTDLTYNKSAQKPIATAENLVNNDACTVTVSGEQTNVGNYTATASALSNNNYKLPSSATQEFSITAKTLTITAEAKSKTYGDDDPSLTYTSSGLIGSDAITGSLSRVAGEDVGTYAITQGTVTAGDNYCITYTGASLTVEQREVTLTWSGTSLTYNHSAQKPTATAGNLVNEDVIGVTVTGEETVVGTGYTATATALTGDKSGNYKLPSANTQTFSIGKKTVTVSGITAANKEYDGNTTAPISTAGVVFGGLEEGDELTVATTGTFADVNVGTGKTVSLGTLTLGGTSINNYELAATGNQTSTTADITAKGLTITADAQSKTYGETDPELTYTSSGIIGTDEITGSLSRVEGENVGTYAIVQGTVTAGDNYSITYTDANLTIGQKALTINAKDQTITYGGSISSAISDVTIDTTNGLVAGDELTSISLTKTETNYSATAYDDDITPSDAVVKRGETDVTANYNISYGKGDLIINKADLTISADNKEREVSEANPTFTVTYSGFVNGDDESMLTIEPIIGCNATASSPVGTYTITPSGAEAANYNIIYNNATLTIYRNFSFTGTNVWRTWYGSEDLTVNANHMETYVVTGVTASEVTITQIENGEIYKNTPMLLKYKINSTTPTIRADAADAELTPPGGLSSSFIGGLADLTTYIGSEVYILAGSEFVRTSVTEGNTAFDASKCFVYISGAAASRLSIGDDTTDIRVVERESTNDEWYTINGQKLGKRPIRPGVYVHNNKKVVVK